jgi:hypothetical protein
VRLCQFANDALRPIGVGADFLAERPVHLGNRRSPNSLRKSKRDDSGRSQVATNDQDKIAVECLHPKAANWHSRPIAATRPFANPMTAFLIDVLVVMADDSDCFMR